MWFIHLWPSLPPIAKQIGDALTTAARGSSEHNQQNYLAQLQVVHRTDKQLPTTFFCSPSLIMLQTPLGNHILLLQYDLSPLLTTRFLIKCMNAMFYRREKLLRMFRGSPVCTEDALPTSCRNSLQAPGPPLPLAKCYPHPTVDCLALFLQRFWLTHYLQDSTSLLLYSKKI